MICPSCKSLIRDDAVFCPVCGKPVRADAGKTSAENNGNSNGPVAGANESVSRIQNSQGSSAGVRRPAGTDARPGNGPSAGNTQGSSAGTQRTAGETGARRGSARPAGNAQSPRGPRPQASGQTNAGGGRPEGAPNPGGAGRGPNGNADYDFRRRNTPPNGQPYPGGPNPGVNSRPALSPAQAAELKKELRPKALISFICGILSICSVTFDLPCGIIGLVLGIIVRKAYPANGLEKDTDLKLANAGFICSIIGIVIGVIGLIVILAVGAGLLSGIQSLLSLNLNGYY